MARIIAESAFDMERPIRNDAPLTRTMANPSAISIKTLIESRVAASAAPA
jgi:hypothetical protein